MNYYGLLKLDFFNQNEYCSPEYYYINVFIKVIFFVFLVYYYYLNIPIIKMPIDIDNGYNFTNYEENIDFSEYSTDIKVIALYFPRFQNISERFRGLKIVLNEWKNINITTQTSNISYHYPRVPGDQLEYLGYYDCRDEEMVAKQVELAKSHGIYGFGIFYYWFSGKKFLDTTADLFLESKVINFPFFLIWRNEHYYRRFLGFENDLFLVQNYSINDTGRFVKDIKKYLVSKRYIKIKGKPALGIFDPSTIPDLRKTLLLLRKEAKDNGIGEIFLLATSSRIPRVAMRFLNAAYDLPPMESYLYRYMKKQKNFFYYSTLLFRTKLPNKKYENYTVYKGNVIEWDNTHTMNRTSIFDEYTPEKFYISNKILLNWTHENLNESDRYYFINGWNNWLEGSYLEPDENYGYASINALSKALFDLPYKEKNTSIPKLMKGCHIAVQAHVFYEDLIDEIINKTNNIPVKYDLYITTNSTEKKNIIEEYVKAHSNANKYEILVIKNKGRDMLPLLYQLKFKVHHYKYLCHIHTKKSNFTDFGEVWRKYLYENLLGNSELISEILHIFEENEQIGFIYPEIFYRSSRLPFILNKNNTLYLNQFINRMFPGNRAGRELKFPLGNMFWARVDAVRQAFSHKFIYMYDKNEAEASNITHHANEAIWLYFVKQNNYSYQTIFNNLY